MKNVLVISTQRQELLSNIDDGTNTLFINGTGIDSSEWTGTGNYTDTVNGHEISIAKVADTTGNVVLEETGTYTYRLKKLTAGGGAVGIESIEQTTTSYEDGGVNIVTATLTNGYESEFEIRNGKKGSTGATGATGATPDISMSATVDANTGTPAVTVTKSGTAENPAFALAFSNLKGAAGATGATPDISMSATVDANTGTPAVTVTESGTAENPAFALAFSNLKGPKGDTFTYSDLTPAQIADLKADLRSFYKKSESLYTTTAASTSTIPIGIDGYRSTDVLIVDINGLVLIQGTEYTISGTNIVLTSPLPAGQQVHFTALRASEVTQADYATIKGDTGATPDISMSASVDANTGTPAVTVTKSGTTENPAFALAFSNLKGATGSQGPQGPTGATGATPDITMSATVDANTGTPAVTVTKGGTTANPTFVLAFSNLKGEKGDTITYDLGLLNGTNKSITDLYLEFVNSHKGEHNIEGRFYITASQKPSGLPADTLEWNYCIGRFIIRDITPSAGNSDGLIKLYGYGTSNIAIKPVTNNSFGAWGNNTSLKSPVYLANLSWIHSNGVYYATVETYSDEVKSVSLQGWGALDKLIVPYIGSSGKNIGLMVTSTSFLSGAWVGMKATF